MRTRSKIESDGSVTERTNLSDMPNTYAKGTKSLKQRYDENKGGYARALQSGKVVEKNGKKVVTDPDTGLEYEYKGIPEKTSEKTRSGLSSINNQMEGDFMAGRKRSNLSSSSVSQKAETSVENKKMPAQSSAIANTAEKQAESKSKLSTNETVAKRNERIGASIDAAFMSSPIMQQLTGVYGGARVLANKFSEKYQKAREKEKRERSLKR